MKTDTKHERETGWVAMGPGYLPVVCSCGWHGHAVNAAEADEKFALHVEEAS